MTTTPHNRAKCYGLSNDNRYTTVKGVVLGDWSHTYKEVRKALQYAESEGFIVKESGGGHGKPWGFLMCPYNDNSCNKSCRKSIAGSPRNEGTLAKQIKKHVDWCNKYPRQ